jgi:hypothetical protein
MSVKRADTRAAVAGLFERPSATGGRAGTPQQDDDTVEPPSTPQRDRRGQNEAGPPHDAVPPEPARVRLGVELTENEVGYLRALSRPTRTGGPRTLGSKFVAAGVLTAAIELLRSGAVDMHGVAAGDLTEMTARARAALMAAAREPHRTGRDV